MALDISQLVTRRAPVRDGIPRYVDVVDYADSFGEQWQRYRRVQLDSETGKSLSRDRLFRGTGWLEAELEGELVLEAGCGAGRFTEVLVSTGARVVAVDASTAVDACRVTCGDRPNLAIVQADLFALPFAPGSFDRVFCYGVLQHTPDPEAAFLKLVDQVRPGGLIAVDVYRPREYLDYASAKVLWRPITTRLPKRWLHRVVEWYVPRWLPVDDLFRRFRRFGRFYRTIVPCWNPAGLFALGDDERVAWAVLDTYDALAPRYDKPRSLEQVRAWSERAGLIDVDVHYGGNGVELNARRES